MHRVVAGILEKDGKFMIARRAPHKAMAGKWEFPGGKVEPNESFPDALRREFSEEFDLAVDVGRKVGKVKHDYENAVVELTAYLITTTSEVISSIDHDRISWSSLADLHSYDLADADRPFVSLLEDSLRTEFEQ